jgi:hypothetical protein
LPMFTLSSSVHSSTFQWPNKLDLKWETMKYKWGNGLLIWILLSLILCSEPQCIEHTHWCIVWGISLFFLVFFLHSWTLSQSLFSLFPHRISCSAGYSLFYYFNKMTFVEETVKC